MIHQLHRVVDLHLVLLLVLAHSDIAQRAKRQEGAVVGWAHARVVVGVRFIYSEMRKVINYGMVIIGFDFICIEQGLIMCNLTMYRMCYKKLS